MKSVICAAPQAIGSPTDFSSQRMRPLCWRTASTIRSVGCRSRKPRQPLTEFLLEAITLSTSMPSCPTALLGLTLGMSFHRSSGVADAGEVLPLNTGTRLDMEHCKFGLGEQRDLQGVHEGDFAGLAKIRRVKNGFYFDCLKQVGLAHNPVFFLLVAGSGATGFCLPEKPTR